MKNILKKWTPVKTKTSENGFELQVWGRTYRFENSFLPTQITTQGEELLYAPACFDATFGDIKGEWTDFWYLVTEETDEKAIVLVSAKCENVVANATVTIEFDGFLKMDFRIMSSWEYSRDNKARLTSLSFNIKVNNEKSSLFHYWPNSKNSIVTAANVINAGATENAVYPFKPYIWTGWEKGGLGIFCGESAKGFELEDEDKCIYINRGECTDITMHILDHMPHKWAEKGEDYWGSTLETIFFTIGFQATPVKPMPEKLEEYYKRMHTIWIEGEKGRMHPEHEFMYTEGYAEKCAAAGVKWLILHEEWSVIQNWGRPEDEKRFKAFVDKCHALGMKVMAYFGYEYSSLAPGFSEKAQGYLIKNSEGAFTGGWQRKPWQRDFMVCYNGNYSDEMIKRAEHVMDDYGVDGIYTDGTFVPWECANEVHGCGYRDKDGKLHVTYPILAVREHVKKLYEAVVSRGGILDTHQSSCCIMPTLSFCDSYYDGENIQKLLRNNPESMTPDSFKAEFFGYNLGIPCNFIAYSSEGYPMSFPAGFSLIHNVFPRPSQLWDLDYVSGIWKIFDEYKLDGAKWIPYYENDKVTADAMVSLYEGEHNVAVIYDVKLGRDKVTLCADGYSEVLDLFDGKKYEVTDGKASLPSKPRELQMYLLK